MTETLAGLVETLGQANGQHYLVVALAYFAARAKAKGVELNRMVNDLLKRDIALIEEVK